MSHEEIHGLLEKFLDDRESLDDEQWERLLAALCESPELLSSLKDQLLLDEALSQQQAVDRRNFSAQVAQRLRDLHRDENELLSQVDEMRSLAFQEYEHKNPRRRRPLARFLTAAALVLIAFGAGAWYVLPGINDRPRVVSVFGTATLIRDDIRQPLMAGESLKYGDRVLTAPKAFAVLDYPDGTVVNVGSQSLAQVSSRFRSGKIVQVDRGAVASSIAPQPRRRPMRFLTPRADAKALGTELLLEVTSTTTRLNVAEGRVELRGLSAGRGVVISSRQYGVSDGTKVDVQPLIWPSSQQGLQVIMEPGQQQPPAGWELRGDTEWNGGKFRFRGGSTVGTSEASRQLTEACQATNQLSLEVVFRADSLSQSGPARIVSMSTDAFTRNFTLGQHDGFLVFRLRTPSTGENGTNPKCVSGKSPTATRITCW